MASERLVLQPYPGDLSWREVTNTSQGGQFLREQIPEGQKIESYRDILTAQSFPDSRGVSPTEFLGGMLRRVGGVCRGVRVNGPKEQVESGFPVAYAQAYCGQQIGKNFGVVMFFKAIQGKDAMYVVQREFRVPPSAVGGVQSFSQDQMAAMVAQMNAQSVANSYLVNLVYLCGDQSAEARCATEATQ